MESRWRNVRDGFIKYRKKLKTKSGDGAKTVKEYKYAKVLSFLIPYLGDRPTSGNLEMDDSDEVDDDAQQETLSVIENDASQTGSQPESLQRKCPDTPSISSLSATGKRRKQMPRDDVDTTICEYLKKKIRSPVKIDEKPDDVDLFLQSMAASIRKLPAHQRAAVKYKIHGIVHEAEMQCSFPKWCRHLSYNQRVKNRTYPTQNTRSLNLTLHHLPLCHQLSCSQWVPVLLPRSLSRLVTRATNTHNTCEYI